MNTWLFAWNPKKHSWDDNLYSFEELVNEQNQLGYTFMKWSCGGTKSIEIGDRIFFIRLGESPKGIIASGFAASKVFQGTHWDKGEDDQGKKANRIHIRLDKISKKRDVCVDISILQNNLPQFHWFIQASGVRIAPEIGISLEQLWSEY